MSDTAVFRFNSYHDIDDTEIEEIIEGFYGTRALYLNREYTSGNILRWYHVGMSTEYASEAITNWFEGIFYDGPGKVTVYDFMDELAYLGFIPAGAYLIEVTR